MAPSLRGFAVFWLSALAGVAHAQEQKDTPPDIPGVVAPVKLTVGEAEIYLLTDGASWAPASWMFGGDDEAVDVDDLAELFGEDLRAELSFGCVLVKVDGKNVLLDTSLGFDNDAFEGAFKEVRPLVEIRSLLDMVGLALEDIDIVVHSHLHRDHVGWNTIDDDGKRIPLFRNAMHYINEDEHSYWSNRSNPALQERVRYEDNILPLEEADMVKLMRYEDGVEITPSISVNKTPGHTPAHQAIRIDGKNGQVAYYIADVFHTAPQLRRPEWCTRFDSDKESARKSRTDTFSAITKEGAMLISVHLPFPAYGYLSAHPFGGWQLDKEPQQPQVFGRAPYLTAFAISLGILFVVGAIVFLAKGEPASIEEPLEVS